MFQPGDTALISIEWFKQMADKYGLKNLEVRVEVEGFMGSPWSEWDDHPLTKDKSVRWVQVKGEKVPIQYAVPEHFLKRPQRKEDTPEQPWEKKARERREAPITRFKGRLYDDDLPAGLADQLVDAVLAMTLEWRGHFGRGADWDQAGWYEDEPKRRKHMLTSNLRFSLNKAQASEADATAIVAAFDAGEPLDRFIPFVTADRYFCPNCVISEFDTPFVFETNGVVVRPAGDCPNPDGLDTSWDMEFPSGKMLVGNDFRDITRIPGDRDINKRIGTHLQILDYAHVGLALGFGIGNTCPGLYKLADGSFEIGSKRQRVWQVEKTEGATAPTEGRGWCDLRAGGQARSRLREVRGHRGATGGSADEPHDDRRGVGGPHGRAGRAAGAQQGHDQGEDRAGLILVGVAKARRRDVIRQPAGEEHRPWWVDRPCGCLPPGVHVFEVELVVQVVGQAGETRFDEPLAHIRPLRPEAVQAGVDLALPPAHVLHDKNQLEAVRGAHLEVAYSPLGVGRPSDLEGTCGVALKHIQMKPAPHCCPP